MRISTKLFIWMTLLCMTAQRAWADGVQYKYRSWDDATKTVVEETGTCSSYTEITSSGSGLEPDPEQQPEYWYVVKGNNVTIPRILINGTTLHLILCDGAKLTTYINFKDSPGSIYIYGQAAGTGELVADGRKSNQNDCAGIGSTYESYGTYGTVVVHGGKITAYGSKYAAGIGGSKNKVSGSLTVYGGTVFGDGTGWGAGIGDGEILDPISR